MFNLDVGCLIWMLGVGSWMFDSDIGFGNWMFNLDVGCWMLDVGCLICEVVETCE